MDIARIAGSLKWLARTGWMQRGVPQSMAESVSQHSFEAALIALDIGFELERMGLSVNPLKASVLALIHDIAESVVGDIPKWSSSRMGGSKDSLEAEAVRSFNVNRGVKDLYAEYQQGDSLEAGIARLSDYLSTCIQARRYIELGFNVEEIYRGMREAAFSKASSCCPQITSYITELCHD
jgi:putative hydrolase of HD superfamily